MKQYLDLLQNIIENGVEKESGRENMPNTISISHSSISHNLSEGFPLLTTKKIYWKGVVHELLWFLRGDTNIKYLVDNDVHIWDQDAYRWYLTLCKEEELPSKYTLSFENFILAIKYPTHILNYSSYNKPKYYTLGDCGKIYGYQWRNQNGIDQVKECLENLQKNPYSRYHIIDSWNKADFPEMALPPCHCFYQFIVRPIKGERLPVHNKYAEKAVITPSTNPKFYLDLNMYQRSCDTMLGVPFNIASMSLLNLIFSKACNMIPGEITWIGGDIHLYVNHLEQVNEQLQRTPRSLPKVTLKKDIKTLSDIENLVFEDFILEDYNPYPPIKAQLSTGLK